VLNAGKVTGQVGNRKFDNQAIVLFAQQRLWRALCHDLSGVHDRYFVAQHLGLIHVVCCQQHRCTAGPNTLYQVPEIAPRLRVQARGWFVKKNDARAVDQSDGEQQALSLPTGELAVVSVQQVAQGALLDDLFDIGLSFIQGTEHLNGFADRDEVLQRRILKLNAGFLAKFLRCDFTVIVDLARGGGRYTFDDLNRRGLACAVRTQQTETDTFRDSKTDAINGDNSRIVFSKVSGFEGDCHSGRVTKQLLHDHRALYRGRIATICNQAVSNGQETEPGIAKMARLMKKIVLTAGFLAVLLAAPVVGATVNKSVKIEAGTEASGASSVNGSITVGADAIVTGAVKTVNGSIRIAAGASIEKASTVNGSVKLADNVKAHSLRTVNGSVQVGESVTIDGEIDAVNGKIRVGAGTTVEDSVSNVNGQIRLSGAQIGGDVSTVSGDISVVEGTVVEGGLLVEKPNNWGWGKSKKRKPRIVIGPGSKIFGVITLEREVELFISDTAEVGGVTGVMSMDDAVRFSGEHP